MPTVEELKSRLRRDLGFQDKSLDLPSIRQTVGDFSHQLQETDFAALIDEVVVPETWFFREPEAFNALNGLALEQVSKSPAERLYILSAGCSSGEEPYSVAMSLLDAGLSEQHFHVDAIDISRKMLAKAEYGLYGKNSFRTEKQGFINRYFNNTGKGFRIDERLKRIVRFRRVNLLEMAEALLSSHYHFVFCRNVLIYLHNEARKKIMDSIHRVLRPEGTLFSGAAETMLYQTAGFDAVRIPRSYAFRIDPKQKIQRPFVAAVSEKKQPPFVQKPPQATSTRNTNNSLPIISLEKDAPAQWYSTAKQLADEGRTGEALDLCKRLIEHGKTNTDIYVLTALLHQSSGNTHEALSYYQRALYLDPNHYEALVHTIFLLESKKEYEKAKLFRQRVKRLEKKDNYSDGIHHAYR